MPNSVLEFLFFSPHQEKKVCFPSGLIKISDFLPLLKNSIIGFSADFPAHWRLVRDAMEPFSDGGGGYDDVPANIEVPKQ